MTRISKDDILDAVRTRIARTASFTHNDLLVAALKAVSSGHYPHEGSMYCLVDCELQRQRREGLIGYERNERIWRKVAVAA